MTGGKAESGAKITNPPKADPPKVGYIERVATVVIEKIQKLTNEGTSKKPATGK